MPIGLVPSHYTRFNLPRLNHLSRFGEETNTEEPKADTASTTQSTDQTAETTTETKTEAQKSADKSWLDQKLDKLAEKVKSVRNWFITKIEESTNYFSDKIDKYLENRKTRVEKKEETWTDWAVTKLDLEESLKTWRKELKDLKENLQDYFRTEEEKKQAQKTPPSADASPDNPVTGTKEGALENNPDQVKVPQEQPETDADKVPAEDENKP